MKLSTGRWVSGDNFFDRESELLILKGKILDGNHVLLTGQRRMGKTSIVRELGQQLRAEGWEFLFTDVEGANCAEDVFAEMAKAVHPIHAISSRIAKGMQRLFSDHIEEVSAYDFSVKFRAGLNAGSWRRHGEKLFRDCAEHDKRVLLVIDELPIFLKRILHQTDGEKHVDEFLSWMRSVIQSINDGSLVIIVSGSIGLEPLVRRLGIPDRINHLESFRLEPWDREVSIACFEHLAANYNLQVSPGVANVVYEALGTGIPHHVQSFFSRLQDFATMKNRDMVTVEDVHEVYRTGLLGPSGQNDLVHYVTRLKEALDDEQSHAIAMEILAEAAIQNHFTTSSRRCLDRQYSSIIDDVHERITEVLEILVHDGYLKAGDNGYSFPSRLLKDWWKARFRDHYEPLESRGFNDKQQGSVQ